LNSYELFKQAASLMGLKNTSNWILPDDKRFCDQDRNLTMDNEIIEKYCICFNETVDGIEEAIKRPYRL